MARNPDRIYTILDQLRTYWLANHDLRLGQILSTIATDKMQYSTDVFYMEDKDLLDVLWELNNAKTSEE